VLGRLIRAIFRPGAASKQGAVIDPAQVDALLAQRRIGEARAVAQRALEYDPGSAAARLVIGRCEMLEGRWPEASRTLARVLEVDPRNVDAMLDLGAVRRVLGDEREAIRLGRQALANSPDSVAAGQLLAALLLPGEHYLSILEKMHKHLRPATYVEVGVFAGESLGLVQPDTSAVGIDPLPRLTETPPPNVQLFAETSDSFFARDGLRAALAGRPVEMAFIDGMHHFEFALRDFINLERHCRPDSTILFHDVYPVDASVADRDRRTMFWTGDVWRVIAALRKHRPDLEVCTLSCPPSGLGMVRRLDPDSRLLEERLDAIVAEFRATPYPEAEPHKRDLLGVVTSVWPEVAARLDRVYP
jgi:hypothetical protein